MSKPDTTEFARQLLFNLAALSAEVREVKLLLCDVLAEIKHLPVDQIRSHYSKTVAEETTRLYENSAEAAKIDPPGPEDEPPAPGPEANPRV